MRERIIRWGVTWQAGYNRVREIRVQKPDSTYSNVEYIRFPRRTGGGTLCAGPAHGFLFRILVEHSSDPSHSPSECMMGQESLAREMGCSVELVRDTLNELKIMRVIYVQPRRRNSNSTWVFFDPYPAPEEGSLAYPSLEPIPVVAVEPLARPASGARNIRAENLLPDTHRAVTLLQEEFPDHRDFAYKDHLDRLPTKLQKGLKLAGGYERFRLLVLIAIHDDRKDGPKTREHIADSGCLGNYISGCMKKWPEQFAKELAAQLSVEDTNSALCNTDSDQQPPSGEYDAFY
jgi:hypothetical protein